MCAETFEALDKDGNGSITLEDSIWAKPFLDAYDIDKDGKVTLNEYLFACSRQLAENPGWTPTVALLAHGAKTATNGKYLVLGLKGAGKTTLIKHLKLGELETDAGVDRLAYKGLVRPLFKHTYISPASPSHICLGLLPPYIPPKGAC
eukprot:SAG11_NODE_1572_length_4664_cov_8.611172_5_plen_148_part_00